MKKIGLYFGTFNPIHIGHLVIANHLAEHSDLTEIWFVVTPQSPFKTKQSLLENHHRLEMVYRATKEYPKLNSNDIEFKLPQPNYTIKTLIHLSEKHPEYQFTLIMGEDNLKNFHKWEKYELILEQYSIVVYPRISGGDIPESLKNHPKITKINAPIMEISSSYIRQNIKAGKGIKPLLPPVVWQYVDQMNFYK